MNYKMRTIAVVIAAILFGFGVTFFVLRIARQPAAKVGDDAPPAAESVAEKASTLRTKEPRAREDHPRRGSRELHEN